MTRLSSVTRFCTWFFLFRCAINDNLIIIVIICYNNSWPVQQLVMFTLHMNFDTTLTRPSIVWLTEKCSSTLDPMLHRLLCVQKNCKDKVCGVTGGGQLTTSFACLVQRASVPVKLLVDVHLLCWLQPDDRHCVVEDLVQLFSHCTPACPTQTTTLFSSLAQVVMSNGLHLHALLYRWHPWP